LRQRCTVDPDFVGDRDVGQRQGIEDLVQGRCFAHRPFTGFGRTRQGRRQACAVEKNDVHGKCSFVTL
jgi:hypothetical protein